MRFELVKLKIINDYTNNYSKDKIYLAIKDNEEIEELDKEAIPEYCIQAYGIIIDEDRYTLEELQLLIDEANKTGVGEKLIDYNWIIWEFMNDVKVEEV